jgi:hypothetical protein
MTPMAVKTDALKRPREDKRLPLMPPRQGVVTPNVLHVIKFQVADKSICVTALHKMKNQLKKLLFCRSQGQLPQNE